MLINVVKVWGNQQWGDQAGALKSLLEEILNGAVGMAWQEKWDGC